jgi:hypothetical protein
MKSEFTVQGRRSTVLAAAIGTALAAYAGGAQALEFEFDNGTRINWNTTLSVGTSWRAESPHPYLYTRADGALIGKWSGDPLMPGEYAKKGDGLAGNQAGGDGNLNWGKGDRFSTPFKIISDVEIKKGNFGGLLRVKAWYDEALNSGDVRVGNQANNFNGVRPGLGPVPGYGPCVGAGGAPRASRCRLRDRTSGRRASSVTMVSRTSRSSTTSTCSMHMCMDRLRWADTDLQLRLGNQVVNWGESVFIQGVNQINPIDVPAARRAGAELKEILLPVWMAYANWGLSFGSVEAFYQLQWNNTSIDGCGNYWARQSRPRSSRSTPASCRSATVLGNGMNVQPVPRDADGPLIPQLGSNPFQQAINGTYAPLPSRARSQVTAASSALRSASRWTRSTPRSACTR